VTHSNELERCFISTTNLFISNDNPPSRKLNTTLAARPPVAMAPQWPVIPPASFSQTNP
jgi:hypothetical protein